MKFSFFLLSLHLFGWCLETVIKSKEEKKTPENIKNNYHRNTKLIASTTTIQK
jgi:hypothetical protein